MQLRTKSNILFYENQIVIIDLSPLGHVADAGSK